MAIVQDLKVLFANFLLQRRIFRKGSQPYPLNIDKANSIGILYKSADKKDSEAVKALKKELKDKGKHVSLLEYYDFEDDPDHVLSTKDYSFITYNDLTFFDLPKDSAIEDFSHKKYDIVISLCLNQCLPLHYVMAIAQADFKIGVYRPDYANLYDFMIDAHPNTTLIQLIDTIKYYLHSIHKN